MAEGNDEAEKTEEPTHRRLQEAVKKGQVAFSREVTNFLILVLLALNIIWFAPYYMQRATIYLSQFIHSVHDIRVDRENITFFFKNSCPTS